MSDYPTDEQTTERSLNTLSSHYKTVFGMGMEDVPVVTRKIMVVERPDSSHVQSSLGDGICGQDDNEVFGGTADVDNKAAAPNMSSSNNSIASNQGDVNPEVRRHKVMNRFHILELARRRMATATSNVVVPVQMSSGAVWKAACKNEVDEDQDTATKDDTLHRIYAAEMKHFGYDCSDDLEEAAGKSVCSNGNDDDSFLGNASVENATTTDMIVHNGTTSAYYLPPLQHDPYDPHYNTCDESLPSYNIHASTQSLSTATSPSQPGGFRNTFASLGGDIILYSPATRKLSSPGPVNCSFESPTTVVASGSKPTMLGSRVASLTSTAIDELILNESYLAVRNLGNSYNASEHRNQIRHGPIVPAAAITRKNAASNQSIDSYSYNRAFRDCPSKHSSAYSTLTDEYHNYYDVSRKTGITAVVEENECNGSPKSERVVTELQNAVSGPVDIDSNVEYESSSIARPPGRAPHIDMRCWMGSYRSSQHLSSIIQYPSADTADESGEGGEGCVDEEAATRYASRRCGCGFSAAYCMPRLLMWSAVVLLMVSAASVTFGVLLHTDNEKANSLIGRPYSATGGGDSLSSENDADLGGSDDAGPILVVPEIMVQQSTSSPTSSPAESPSADETVGISDVVQAVGDPSQAPSSSPSSAPSVHQPTYAPSYLPTNAPFNQPTQLPKLSPTSPPTLNPNISSTSSFLTTMPTPLPTQLPTNSQLEEFTTRVKASRDTYIKQNALNWNYGFGDYLRVDQDPRTITVIAFDISSINDLLQASTRQYDPSNETHSHQFRSMQTALAGQVTDAKLRLYSIETSRAGGSVYALTNARQWREEELTWDSAREEVHASGETFISSIEGDINEGAWYEIDVIGAFECCVEQVGPMFLNLLIRSDSADGVSYASKEYESGAYAPELILTFSTGLVSQLLVVKTVYCCKHFLSHCSYISAAVAEFRYSQFYVNLIHI